MDGTPLEHVPDPLVGRTIGGRYLVGEPIGAGGMGMVYRGRHQLVGRDVAVKFLAPRFAKDKAARERFLREARAANRIDHENIIEITDFGETPDQLVFLVMEYLDGVPLATLVEKGPLDPERALSIAWQLANALARAHELDVIHRDIKPDNVFVLRRRGADFVKLLDFGLAKVAGEQRLTATGKVLGTPEYLAPEQARGEALTGETDQYQLGCVLYEMLTGQLPFEGASAQVVLKHLQEPPQPPSGRAPGLPFASEIDALVLRMLAKHPAERFTDAYHLADELRALVDRLQAGRSTPPLRPSGTHSVPAAGARATQPWLDAAEETWATRLSHFRRLLGASVQGGPEVAAARRAVEATAEAVEHARRTRVALGENLLRAKQSEDAVRASRRQLGHAAEELGRDESRATRRVTELSAAVRRAQQQLDEVGVPILRGIERSHAELAEAGQLTPELVQQLRALSEHAALWLDAREHVAPLRMRLEAAEREREDLAFQIAQLKGRFGIVDAEAEDSLGQLREQAEELEQDMNRALEHVSILAERAVQALSAMGTPQERLFAALGGS